MRYKNALLLYNGNAGQEDMGKRLGQIVPVLAPQIGELILKQTEGPQDAERICREHGEAVEMLLVLGGDGTVHECVNGLAGLSHPPVVGILPGGTCNDFSRTLGMPQDLDQAAAALLEAEPRRLDVGQAGDRYFSNFFGIGLITETSENIDRNLKGKLGKLSYFLSTLQTVTNAESFDYVLEPEGGERLEGEAVMILVANGRFLGTNALPGTLDSAADGEFDVYIVREAGLPLLIEVLSQRNQEEWTSDNPAIAHLRTRRLRLSTAMPKRADTDGEIYLETPVELTVLPEHLRYLTVSEA
ncbi:YegS/Rv2252/BmrU family lipid kinase [Paenibacillus sp. IB182496]|uniref:YegS/Rv2252/BmrU family lipid kinase n=1 Tax=Paenibacillus sabuli TaxID=2772509 RepID=A0A927BU98_9BACL|nr:YegS/Rv2252/BmrU family lipid kinase [Paenibacillus sabuli]MBD2846941.1 YegS/Rv2252/BmrU family lipid kinase [Paenibacillus sabuli]